MRKERNKTRRNPKNLKEPKGKRQKVDEEEYRERRDEWGRPKGSERRKERQKDREQRDRKIRTNEKED